MNLQEGSLIRIMPNKLWGVFDGKDVRVSGVVSAEATCANIGAFVIKNLFKEDKMDARTHRTREGVELLIAEMGDEHLLNTINFWLSKIERARASVDAPKRTGFNKLLYRYSEEDESDWAETAIEEFYIMAPRYFMEAVIRGLNIHEEVRRLQVVMGRDQRLVDRPLLESGTEDVDDYYPEDPPL